MKVFLINAHYNKLYILHTITHALSPFLTLTRDSTIWSDKTAWDGHLLRFSRLKILLRCLKDSDIPCMKERKHNMRLYGEPERKYSLTSTSRRFLSADTRGERNMDRVSSSRFSGPFEARARRCHYTYTVRTHLSPPPIYFCACDCDGTSLHNCMLWKCPLWKFPFWKC